MSDPLTTQEVTLYDKNDLPLDSVLVDAVRRLAVETTVSITPSASIDLWQMETLKGKGFQVLTGEVLISNTSENPIALLKNPNASGKTARFYQLRTSIYKGTSVVRGVIRYYRNPTITANGTALTINKILLSQAASSVLTAYKLPTISANGTLINNISVTTENFTTINENLGRFLEQNENILVTFEPSTSGTSVNFFFNWVEENP